MHTVIVRVCVLIRQFYKCDSRSEGWGSLDDLRPQDEVHNIESMESVSEVASKHYIWCITLWFFVEKVFLLRISLPSGTSSDGTCSLLCMKILILPEKEPIKRLTYMFKLVNHSQSDNKSRSIRKNPNRTVSSPKNTLFNSHSFCSLFR